VIDGESMTVMRRYVQDEVNQEDSEPIQQNEVDGMNKGADSSSTDDANPKERLVAA